MSFMGNSFGFWGRQRAAFGGRGCGERWEHGAGAAEKHSRGLLGSLSLERIASKHIPWPILEHKFINLWKLWVFGVTMGPLDGPCGSLPAWDVL